MKKYISYIIIAALVVSQVSSAMKINNLEYQIRNANNRISNLDSSLNSNISSIYSNVDDMLNEQASIIYKASTTFGELDIDALEVPVTFSIEPKEVSDTTTVTLDFGGEMLTLDKSGTVYEGTKIFPLSGEIFDPNIVIEESGIKQVTSDYNIRVEGLIFDHFFPMLYAHYSGGRSTSNSAGSDEYEYSQDGMLFIEAVGDRDSFVSANFATYINGELIENVEISQDILLGASELELDNTHILIKGDILESFVTAVDHMGFIHETLIEYYVAGEENQREPYYDSHKITSPDGTVIYESNNEGKLY